MTGSEIRRNVLELADSIDTGKENCEAYNEAETIVLSTLNDGEVAAYNIYMARICKFI